MKFEIASRGMGFLGVVTLLLVSTANVARAQRCETDETDTLIQNDGAAADRFGRAVAIDGNAIVVGAHQDDDNGPQSGSVYVYRDVESSWFHEAKLTPMDAEPEDHFGRSVAIRGDVMVVGAYLDDDACPADPDCDSGAAYVFRFNGGEWQEEAKLIASDAAAHDFFGWSVAIDHDVIVVGAYLHDDITSNSGTAYVYRYDGATWVEEDKLLAPDADTDDFFGFSVAVSGDRVLVGSEADDDRGFGSGSAYVFRLGLGWEFEQKLTASDGSFGALFGFSADIDNQSETIVIGAICDSQQGDCSGAAYVFFYDDNGTPQKPEDDFWYEHTKLLAPSAGTFDQFGFSVSVSDDAILVGKHVEDFFGVEHEGSAILYRLHDNLTPEPEDDFWFDQAVFGSEPERREQFGFSVAVDGDTAITGAHEHDGSETDPGSVAVFQDIWLDTDNDTILDSCDNCIEFFNPDQADCNDDGVGDVCEIELLGAPDCNENRIPDECDIASGTSEDCDGDEIPDECVGFFFIDVSEELSPFGWEFPQSHQIIAPPPAGDDAIMLLFYRGDFNSPLEWIDLEFNGVQLEGFSQITAGNDCPEDPDLAISFISADDLNELLALGGGNLTVNMMPNEAVDPNACADPPSLVQFVIAYPAITETDCNANFIPDICDVRSGASKDLNENDRPDECEPDAWFEDFEAYDSGSSLQDQGGWKGWNNDPSVAPNVAAGTNAEVRSQINSVRIKHLRNGVREFDDYTAGRLTFMTYQFIPEDMDNETRLYLLNRYHDALATRDFEDPAAGDEWSHFRHPRGLNGATWTVAAGVYRLETPEIVPADAGLGAGLDVTGQDPYYSNGFWSATVVREANSGSDLFMRGGIDVSDRKHYRFGWSEASGGTLFIARVDRGDITTIGSAGGFTQTVGDRYVIEAGANGPDLELRMWAEGDPRPEDPQVTATDTTYETGFNGVFARAQSEGPIAVDYDDVNFTPPERAQNFSTRLRMSAETLRVTSLGPGSNPGDPLEPDAILENAVVVDEWIQIRVEIDLGADTQSIYYNDELMITKSWIDGATRGGSRSLEAVNIRAVGSSDVFYDDMSITPEATSGPCDPCDMNCDGVVDASDIEFFIDILFNGLTPCGACTADTNGDGRIDTEDIEGFIQCLFP